MHISKEQKRYISKLDTHNFVALDTSTTGIDIEKDEVLTVTLADHNGNIVFSELVKPSKINAWPDATLIHGIKPDDVKDAKPLWFYIDTIRSILDSASIVVGYNLKFHLMMMSNSGFLYIPESYCDLMRMYASVFGEWSDWKNDYLWVKLSEVAERYRIPFNKLDRTNDARVVALSYKQFVKECKRPRWFGK